EQDQAGALPAALSISRDAKSRCQRGLHRLRRGGSTPPSRRDWVANFDSEAPALNRRELGANPRRPTNFNAPVAQSIRARRFERRGCRWETCGECHFRRVSPPTRAAPLRTERLGVEIPHAAPASAPLSFGSAGHFAH